MRTISAKIILDDGSELVARLGEISGTELGPENDYRFFWAKVDLAFPGAVQSFCPILANIDETTERVHEHIKNVLRVVGVRTWEELPRKRVYVLYAPDAPTGDIVGLSNLDGSEVYLLKDSAVAS